MSAVAQEADTTLVSGRVPLQKPGRSRQDYGTPPDFIEAVVKRFGPIKADLAATYANRVVTDFYGDSEAGGSLVQPWAEDHPTGNLWLNPPFANIDPWAEKCARESKARHGLIIMLTPASIGTDWFASHVHRKAMVIGLSPRIVFVGETQGYPKDLMVTLFGLGMNGFDVWRWK